MLENQVAVGLANSPMTATERLTNEKVRLEERLRDVNAALEAMKKNPEFSQLLDTISRIGHF